MLEGGTDPFQRSSTYDWANRIETLVDKYNTAPAVTTTYGYDEVGQLLSESRPGWIVGYTYDHNGNRATRTKNGVVETYVCDAADKLTYLSDTNGFSRDFSYDLAGRMTGDVRSYNGNVVDSRVYSWNQGGRLVNQTSSLSAQNLNHGYNAAGARVTSGIPGQAAPSYRRAGMSVLAPILSEFKNGSAVASYTPGVSERRGTAAATYNIMLMGALFYCYEEEF